MDTRGKVSAIIKKGGKYYIGFQNKGLIILTPSEKNATCQTKSLNIQSGIFCLLHDKHQDIIWIGTDGQGVYMYFADTFSFNNLLLDTPPYHTQQPIRSIYLDHEHTLWIGTKGNGILRIHQFTPELAMVKPTSFDHLTIQNSNLSDNVVYCFTPDCDRLWIGTENGINYYSYRTKQLKRMPVTIDGEVLKYVHDIQKINDTTLWVSTVGEGIAKVILKPQTPTPEVLFAKRTVLDNGRMAANAFFSSYQENDSTLWFGNRGYGAFCMNSDKETFAPYRFDSISNNLAVNDVFSIHKNGQGYWLGTGSGLLNFQLKNRQPDSIRLVSNHAIHGILEDNGHNIWASSNQGLIKYDTHLQTTQIYNHNNGLEVTEFCDGAFYKDPQSGTLFFGGTNGIVYITTNHPPLQEYMPEITLKGLSVFGEEQNLSRLLQTEKGRLTLRLNHDQNFFQLNFIAIDYIHGNNYSYFYRIKEVNDQWISNQTSGNITLSNLSPGKYTLQIKYKNNINNKESLPKSVTIHITPPWYASYQAYTAYLFAILILAVWFTHKASKTYRGKKQRMISKMNQQKKMELYEDKMRFFTNITHEFCTPLTLIGGPCEKIIAQSDDVHIQQYATVIQQNAQKLNRLIVELLEFSRLETGNQKVSIQPTDISGQIAETARSFEEMAKEKQILYELDIVQELTWNTDAKCIDKIAGNLLSNAFKYTPDRGTVSVRFWQEENQIYFRVANSGQGISQENLSSVFDQYKILDSFDSKPHIPRTGLGLYICKGMVNLLKGKITVESIPYKETVFTVVLPQIQTTDNDRKEACNELPQAASDIPKKTLPTERKDENYPKKKSIMIVEDDESMLWFISDIFSLQYNVLPFNNAQNALQQLHLTHPDLIISDIMMPETDGLTFIQQIKQNKPWNHIPIILLSAIQQDSVKVNGLDSGADMYITKPFNARYLEKAAEHLIQRNLELKAFYQSTFDTFILENGNYTRKEDQSFLEKMMEIIKKNIANPELSIDLLSREMGFSTRQFYRKVQQITPKSPTDIIKECRLSLAESLLLSKDLTIKEIMDQTGFINQTTFYRQFALRYGMPPKQYKALKIKEAKETLAETEKETPVRY